MIIPNLSLEDAVAKVLAIIRAIKAEPTARFDLTISWDTAKMQIEIKASEHTIPEWIELKKE